MLVLFGVLLASIHATSTKTRLIVWRRAPEQQVKYSPTSAEFEPFLGPFSDDFLEKRYYLNQTQNSKYLYNVWVRQFRRFSEGDLPSTSKVGVQETVLLVNHALACGTPAIFVIFVVSRGSSSKALVLLVRMQIRHFRRFRQKPPFFWRDKSTVYQKHRFRDPDKGK